MQWCDDVLADAVRVFYAEGYARLSSAHRAALAYAEIDFIGGLGDHRALLKWALARVRSSEQSL